MGGVFGWWKHLRQPLTQTFQRACQGDLAVENSPLKSGSQTSSRSTWEGKMVGIWGPWVWMTNFCDIFSPRHGSETIAGFRAGFPCPLYLLDTEEWWCSQPMALAGLLKFLGVWTEASPSTLTLTLKSISLRKWVKVAFSLGPSSTKSGFRYSTDRNQMTLMHLVA